MISLIMMTYRPGGIDLFARSFERMSGDYEVIIIDDWPGRVARGTAPQFLKERKVPLVYYGGSKRKSYPDTKGGLCNAMNTALQYVRGNWTVWLSDYSMVPPHWLRQWEAVIRMNRQVYGDNKSLVSGGAIVYEAPKPPSPSDTATWTSPTLTEPKWPWVPREFETFYFAAPIAFFEEINGVDERADHCHCWPVSSKVSQARQLGYRLLIEPQITCHMIDHRTWDNPGEPNPVGAEGLWRITDARSLQREPQWTVPSPNPFDLRTLRRNASCV